MSRSKGSFDFLALPPELRNRVYGLLLKSDGPVHPSTRPPSSVPKGRTHARDGLEHGSALNLLAVNRQIYDEAYGIFYAANELEFYYPVQLQAFMLGLSHQRLSLIKNVTIHYHNVNSGGVNLADMSFRMLRQLSGLRRLHVLFVQDDLKKRLLLTHWISSARYGLKKANPLTLPGMKELFGLRGIDDIFVQDVEFDEALKDIKKDKRYPDDFAEQSREKVYLQFERVMEHLNAALADAQKGKVNAEMLEDDKWHLRDEFPVAPELEHTADKDAIETMDDDSNADDHQGAVEETAQEELAGDSAIGAIARKPARPVTRAMKRAAEEAERARAQADADQDSGAMAEASTETLERIQPSENKTSAAADYPTIEADDDDNEIVVKHVVRPSKQQAETAEGSSQSTLIEAEEEKDDESDVEDSYAMREISVEL